MTLLDLIRDTRTYTDVIDRLALALIRTGPVVTDKVTYSGLQRKEGTFDATMTTQVLPGYPHAKDVPVPAGV